MTAFFGMYSERLGVSISEAAKRIAHPTPFFSVYDLADWEEGGDVFDYVEYGAPAD